MCGIAGIISLNQKIDMGSLIQMGDAMRHGGPLVAAKKLLQQSAGRWGRRKMEAQLRYGVIALQSVFIPTSVT